MATLLPGGDPAWFERRGTRWCYQVIPVSAAGWILMAVYIGASLAVSLLFLAKEEAPALRDWIGWAVLFGAMTSLFIVVVVRMSAPASEPRARGRLPRKGDGK